MYSWAALLSINGGRSCPPNRRADRRILAVPVAIIPDKRRKSKDRLCHGSEAPGASVGEAMICKKCHKEVPTAPYCNQCGAKQVQKQRPKSRGNGQGSVYQLPNKRYIAVKTIGYYLDEDGKKHRRTVSKHFEKRKDAVAALPLLGLDQTPDGKAKKKAATTFKQLYDLWLPTHRAGPSTIQNYKSAMKYFFPIYDVPAVDVDVDDLQECMDECPYGKPTRRNMKTTAGLIYKYGLPRGYFPEKLNLSDYLVVSGHEGIGGVGLPKDYLDKIWEVAGKTTAGDYVLCHCYLGFRPSELLALNWENYNAAEKAFIGGAKTDAGKNRTVTISPKIQPIIDKLYANNNTGPVFCTASGERMSIKVYRDLFYDLLESLGLENPIIEVNGKNKHTYTPHSCRHTFATLMKRVSGADKDKQELIGHANGEQLRYYQDVSLDDLRQITDKI